MKRSIREEKCIGCGKCVADCVNGYIELNEREDGTKVAAFSEKGRCLDCGHCNAICPQGAITGGDNLINPDHEPDVIEKLMSEKRTIRKYLKGESISQVGLDRIIYAAQTAPTDRNRQSARVILVKDTLPEVYQKALDYLVEEVEKTGTINPLYASTMKLNNNRDEILWNAEYLVVLAGRPGSITDAVIAAERMQLEAAYHGIGTAYRGDMKTAINSREDLKNLLGIKSREEVLVCFAMGMTDLKYYRPAVKNNHKIEYR